MNKNSYTKNTNKTWKNYCIALLYFLSIILVCIIAFMYLLPSEESSEAGESTLAKTTSPTVPIFSEQSPDEESMTTDISDVKIDRNEIHINELSAAMDMGRIYPDPKECVDTLWKEADIISYYGNNLVPPYIPDDLNASPNNAAQSVILSKAGEIWEDTVRLDFYQDYYEDGSAKSADALYIPRGFYLKASKIGLLHEFTCKNSKNDGTVSYIDETAVSIGYLSLGYGPYDSDTHEPSGYYDSYAAWFTLNGVEYEIVSSRLELEEIIKIIASIIYNKSNIIISN